MSIGDVFSALGAGECSAVGGAGCIGSVEDENENEDEDEQKRDADESQYSKLAGAWNRCNGLRFGERAMPSVHHQHGLASVVLLIPGSGVSKM